MAAVWVRARAELRRRWRATVLLVVLVGLAGGVVLAAVAGARRTATAMDRFLAYHQATNVAIEGPGPDPDAVRRLPMVADVSEGGYLAMVAALPSGGPDTDAFGEINPYLGLGQWPGVAAGRWAWLLVNRDLHSLAGPVTPTIALLVSIPVTVLVANLVAALPARAAAATRPAVVLRSE